MLFRSRNFFKEYRDYAWDVAFVRDALNLSDSAAIALVVALHAEELIEPYSGGQPFFTVLTGDNDHLIGNHRDAAWRTTTKGNALANVSFARRVHRGTADRALHDFLGRVEDVNGDERWLLKVRRVIVFGSYLDPTIVTLGDVDLAVELEWKEPNVYRRRSQCLEYVQRERAKGRTFRSYLAELTAPEEDVRRYLKGGSRALRLYDARDPILEGSDYQVIYVDGQSSDTPTLP